MRTGPATMCVYRVTGDEQYVQVRIEDADRNHLRIKVPLATWAEMLFSVERLNNVTITSTAARAEQEADRA